MDDIASKVKEKNNDNIQELTCWVKEITRKLDWSKLWFMLWILGKEIKLGQNIESTKSRMGEEIEFNSIWPEGLSVDF